jgi:hypothetical protein
MRRFIAIAAVVFAVIAATALGLVSGAGAAPSRSVRTIHLLARETHVRLLHLGGPRLFAAGNMILATDDDLSPRTHGWSRPIPERCKSTSTIACSSPDHCSGHTAVTS